MVLKKVLVILLLLLLTGFSAMATGQTEAKVAKITIMVGSHGRYLIDKTAEAFHALKPNITVEVVPISSVPQEYWQTYVTMFSAQDGSAHIVGWYPTQIYHMARAGWITPLEELMDAGFKRELSEYDQTAIEINTIEGKLYGLPLYPDALMLYYRTDLLKKYGFNVPQTWAELEKQTLAIMDGENDNSLSGYIWQARKIEGITGSFNRETVVRSSTRATRPPSIPRRTWRSPVCGGRGSTKGLHPNPSPLTILTTTASSSATATPSS